MSVDQLHHRFRGAKVIYNTRAKTYSLVYKGQRLASARGNGKAEALRNLETFIEANSTVLDQRIARIRQEFVREVSHQRSSG